MPCGNRSIAGSRPREDEPSRDLSGAVALRRALELLGRFTVWVRPKPDSISASVSACSVGLLLALTGIEPNGCQFSPVQFGLGVCKHVQPVSRGCASRRHKSATLSLGCLSVSLAVAHPTSLLLTREISRRSRSSSIPTHDVGSLLGPLPRWRLSLRICPRTPRAFAIRHEDHFIAALLRAAGFQAIPGRTGRHLLACAGALSPPGG